MDEAILSSSLSGFIPSTTSNEIVADTIRGSVVMGLAKPEDMAGKPTKKFPVLTDGPGAYWVGEGERIETSKAEYIYPEMTTKKLGVIIPASKEALNDSTIDFFESMKPYIAEAFAIAFDQAALFGTSSPWGTGKSIFEQLTTAGNTLQQGSVTGNTIADDISDVMALVEDGNFDVNGFTSPVALKNTLRKAKDGEGNYIFVDKTKDAPAQIHGQVLAYAKNGAWDKTKAELILGNWDYARYGILQDIEYQILTEATLQTVKDTNGDPLSLAEQDMIALKATMRIAFLNIKDEAFAALTPKAGA